jgi:hypothetical protein
VRRIGGWRLAFAIAVVAHLVALYWPRVDMAGAPEGSDKIGHVVLFAVPVAIGIIATRSWWPAAVFAVHAVLSEALQASWLPDRSGSAADAVADLVGVALGSAVVVVARSRGRVGSHPPDDRSPLRRTGVPRGSD